MIYTAHSTFVKRYSNPHLVFQSISRKNWVFVQNTYPKLNALMILFKYDQCMKNDVPVRFPIDEHS